MKLYSSLKELPSDVEYGLTIGNFDGVHLGHQYLIGEIKKKCEERGLAPLLLTFTPHPLAVLKGKKNFLVSDYNEKLSLLSKYGFEYIVELPFDRDFSNLSPDDFLKNYISNKNIKSIFLGHDFSFGANKVGNHDYVYNYFKNSDVTVDTLEQFKCSNRSYSSTKVRELLSTGNVSEIPSVLGRHYVIQGHVKKGDGRGKGLGFATANIDFPGEKHLPKRGVYITQTFIDDNRYKSLTNIGHNPTFKLREDEIFVETHILNYERNLYGEKINIEFLDKIRDEIKFENAEDLIKQISQDVKARLDFND